MPDMRNDPHAVTRWDTNWPHNLLGSAPPVDDGSDDIERRHRLTLHPSYERSIHGQKKQA